MKSIRNYATGARKADFGGWLSRVEPLACASLVRTPRRNVPETLHPWDPIAPLLYLAGIPYTVREACGSVTVMGAPGSGKSSGSMRTLALAMLARGWAALCFVRNGTSPKTGEISPVTQADPTT